VSDLQAVGERAVGLLRAAAGEDLPAAVLRVEDGQGETFSAPVGGAPDDDAIFLIASITKPLVATAAALLLERGQLDLDDRAATYIPEFGQRDKFDVRIRHLFTHTSGLPDFLPDNDDLRRREAPLSEYLASTCRQPLRFAPGTDISYQSKGYLVLGEVVEQITGRDLPEFMRSELFEPLGMDSTSLGWRDDLAERVIPATPAEDSDGAWIWNTDYWRRLGAAWGGAFSTAADLARVFRLLLDEGEFAGRRILGRGTVRMLLTDHIRGMASLPAAKRLEQGWGLGWAIRRGGGVSLGTGNFGSLVPVGAFGHSGATGTVAWADPATGTIFILLTNGLMPTAREVLRRCGSVIAAAI
jgi:CubicO group peptidase (beta-lactamase class C family)